MLIMLLINCFSVVPNLQINESLHIPVRFLIMKILFSCIVLHSLSVTTHTNCVLVSVSVILYFRNDKRSYWHPCLLRLPLKVLVLLWRSVKNFSFSNFLHQRGILGGFPTVRRHDSRRSSPFSYQPLSHLLS